MILCEKCGRVIQSYEVKYRLPIDGRRRTLCNEDAKEALKALEAATPKATPSAKGPAPVPAAGKLAQTAGMGPSPTAPAPAAGAAAGGAAAAGPPKFTPEELAARKKAAMEKAAAMKAQKEGGAPPS